MARHVTADGFPFGRNGTSDLPKAKRTSESDTPRLADFAAPSVQIRVDPWLDWNTSLASGLTLFNMPPATALTTTRARTLNQYAFM